MKLAQAFTAVFTGAGAAGFSWGLLSQCALPAADDPKPGRTGSAAAPPRSARSVVESSAVFLSRGGPERTGSVSGSHLPEHQVAQWTTRISSSPGKPLLADGIIYVKEGQQQPATRR